MVATLSGNLDKSLNSKTVGRKVRESEQNVGKSGARNHSFVCVPCFDSENKFARSSQRNCCARLGTATLKPTLSGG